MSTLFPPADLKVVLDYISDHADDADLDRIYAALNMRNKVLRAKIAASVKVGDHVTIQGIRPKYHEGLKGEVVSIDGSTGTVRFDKRSTDVLRVKGARRYFIHRDTEQYEAGGFPLSTLRTS